MTPTVQQLSQQLFDYTARRVAAGELVDVWPEHSVPDGPFKTRIERIKTRLIQIAYDHKQYGTGEIDLKFFANRYGLEQ